jgi:hypothetical protein
MLLQNRMMMLVLPTDSDPMTTTGTLNFSMMDVHEKHDMV